MGAQRLHPTFVMYLYLRKQNKLGRLSDASASAPELLELIDVPGNPSKPYFFPLIDRGARTGQSLPSFWRSRNIPGSWSPSSIERLQAGGWLAAGNAFAMPDDHANRALTQMLYGAKTSALALGAFFLRNDGLRVRGEAGPDDIIAGFRAKFRYDHDDEDEFATIYSTEAPLLDAPWLTVDPESEGKPDDV